MPKYIKTALILLSGAAIILLCSTIALYFVKENEREKKVAVQKTLGESLAAKQNLEERLREIELANAEMKANIASQEEKVGALSRSLEEEKAVSAGNLAKIQEKGAEIEKLKSRLEEERAEKEGLLSRLEKLNEEYLNLKFQLQNLLKTREELEEKAKELVEKEGVSLGTIVIKQK